MGFRFPLFLRVPLQVHGPHSLDGVLPRVTLVATGCEPIPLRVWLIQPAYARNDVAAPMGGQPGREAGTVPCAGQALSLYMVLQNQHFQGISTQMSPSHVYLYYYFL